MNYRDPELRERLAAEYVLGTLAGPARKRFERLLREDAGLADRVRAWDARLQPLADSAPLVQPSPALLNRIEQQLGFASATAAPASSAPPPSPPRRAAPGPSFWQRLFAPMPIGALALGVMLGLVVPRMLLAPSGDPAEQALLPASYVGVLADAEGRHGLAISSLRQGRTVDVKQLQPVTLEPGQTLFLWAIDQAGRQRPVGPLPNLKFGQAPLPDTSEKLFADVLELAVSVEPIGQTPEQPTLPFRFRGLCGKFWR
ncbi:MAG: anti-sigma factor [Pseudomonadota bacterium]